MSPKQLDAFQAWLQQQAGKARSDCSSSVSYTSGLYFNGRACAFNDAFEYLVILRGKSPNALVPPWVGKLRHSRGLCDDWGCIRDESGQMVLKVNCSWVLEKDLYRHRKNGTDPTQPVVDYLLAMLNGTEARPMNAPTKQADPASVRQDQLVRRLQNHIAMLGPHQKERMTGKLLIEATAEIQRLRDALWRIAEVGHCGSGVAPRIAKDTLSPNSPASATEVKP